MKQVDTIKKKLRLRLLPNHICHQHYYLRRMNAKLQISYRTFANDSTLKHLQTSNLSYILNSLDILIRTDNNKSNENAVYRLSYNNSDRTVIITGIKIQFIEKSLKKFNSISNYIYNSVRNITQNQFWVSIEFFTSQSALNFKKTIRNQKRQADEQENFDYKIPKKRVRIIIQDEDLFTLLIDAMSQVQSRKFIDDFSKQNQYGLLYCAIQYKTYNQVITNNQQEIQDNFSQSQSKTSQAIDTVNMKDFIQTHDQGIQAQKIDQIQKQSTKLLGNLHNQIVIIQGNKIDFINQTKNSQTTTLPQIIINSLSIEKDIIIDQRNREQIAKLNPINIKKNIYKPDRQSEQTIDKYIDDKQQGNNKQVQKQYSFSLMKRLDQSFKKKDDRNTQQIIECLLKKIPEYLVRDGQKQKSRKSFFDSFWRQSKFGRKNLRKTKLQ